ncbi:MAG: hypothetical protein HOW97_20995 [Catenulispora sp.]|nr:hypothetical protein [Catenulispora sp.]
MATKNTDFSKANSHKDELTDPDVLVAHTNWAELEHAHGSAADLPAGLALFLHDNMTVRSEAASTYLEVVNHQNSIYSATTPVALYVASILPDPRTSRAGLFGSGERFPPMRAPLIDWLGGIADDVSDEALEIGRRCGFRTEDPAITRLRAARPALFEAVAAFVHDPDPAVRHAAITAALLLLDSPEQRGRHREEFTPLIHDLLRTSANQYYHLRALDSLEIWGEDADSLRTEHPQTLHPHVPHPWGQTAWKAGPPIFHLFRKVVADRLPSITVSGPAALLFGTRIEQDWDDRRFLSHFYNGILHRTPVGPRRPTASRCWPRSPLTIACRPGTGSTRWICFSTSPPSPTATRPSAGRRSLHTRTRSARTRHAPRSTSMFQSCWPDGITNVRLYALSWLASPWCSPPNGPSPR